MDPIIAGTKHFTGDAPHERASHPQPPAWTIDERATWAVSAALEVAERTRDHSLALALLATCERYLDVPNIMKYPSRRALDAVRACQALIAADTPRA